MLHPDGAGAQADLQRWLEMHRPGGASSYAPADTYCTKYVEDVLAAAVGFDLRAKIDADTNANEPAWGWFVPVSFSNDGYRYSSPAARRNDAYDTNNVHNYFKHVNALHTWSGNHEMKVGDVLFLHGNDVAGLDHTAIVAAVDKSGRITEIAESDGTEVKYKSWKELEKSYHDQQKELVDFARPDLDGSRQIPSARAEPAPHAALKTTDMSPEELALYVQVRREARAVFAQDLDVNTPIVATEHNGSAPREPLFSPPDGRVVGLADGKLTMQSATGQTTSHYYGDLLVNAPDPMALHAAVSRALTDGQLMNESAQHEVASIAARFDFDREQARGSHTGGSGLGR